MNEHQTSASPLDLGPTTPGPTPDVPPPLPGPVGTGWATGPHPSDDGPTDARADGARPDGSRSRTRRLFEVLRRSPVRRDRDRGMLGGVCAGIARTTGLSVVAVRVIAVLAALLPGTVAGVYLLAWAALPDERGGIHVERAMVDGRPRSLVLLALGGMALIGMLSWALNTWPLLVVAGIVALVVLHKGRSPHGTAG